MAKSLAERITSARSSNTARITDLEKLIPEAELERDRLSQAAVAASSESVDFALSDEDRDEAAAKAERYTRTAKSLDIAIAELREKLDGLRSSEAQKADEAERRAAIAERDEIAALMAAEFPKMVDRMVELLADAKRNAERMRVLGVHEADAETKARGIRPDAPGALRFGTLKIPHFDKPGRAWPAEALSYQTIAPDYAAMKALAEMAEQRAAEHENAQHGIYRVTNRTGLPIFFASRSNPKAVAEDVDYTGAPWEGELHHSVAKRLAAKPAIEVELLQPEAAK